MEAAEGRSRGAGVPLSRADGHLRPAVNSLHMCLGAATVTAVVIACAIALAMPATALAKPVKTKANLIALGLIDPFSGDWEYDFGVGVNVLSTHGPRALCAPGRKVSVYRNQQSGPDTLIASKRTDATFHVAVIRWMNPDPQEIPGSYYAKVKGATKHHQGATLKCQPARTNSIEIVAPHFQADSSPSGQFGRLVGALDEKRY